MSLPVDPGLCLLVQDAYGELHSGELRFDLEWADLDRSISSENRHRVGQLLGDRFELGTEVPPVDVALTLLELACKLAELLVGRCSVERSFEDLAENCRPGVLGFLAGPEVGRD